MARRACSKVLLQRIVAEALLQKHGGIDDLSANVSAAISPKGNPGKIQASIVRDHNAFFERPC